MPSLNIASHPLLDVGAFITRFPVPLETLVTPAEWLELLQAGAPQTSTAPLKSDDGVRAKVRDLLRWGGFKPTGRSKPASEYLIKACEEGQLGSINPAVDACNVVSLHSGLPISVVDVDRLEGGSDALQNGSCRVDIAPEGSSYVFNATGQSIDVGKLVCLFDALGPCANAVKDSQRTKTHPGTRTTLSIVWGAKGLPGRTEQTVAWYQALLIGLGATVEPLHLISMP